MDSSPMRVQVTVFALILFMGSGSEEMFLLARRYLDG